MYEADGRGEGCQSSMTSRVRNSERFPRVGTVNPDGAAMSGRSTVVLLAVHVISSHSSSESSSDSSSARSRKFGSDFSAQSEAPLFCEGTRLGLDAGA